MNILHRLAQTIKDTASLSGHVDKEKAENQIRSNIFFRGPNAWILAFSVVIASVGLNVNSIPVIIGAMLISPLMGPIFGIGFSMGTNDMDLMTTSVKNLLVMMAIALLASTLYFLITPLTLSNPTELLARTNPTLYDVLIALFGGAAGMFEQCRKEKGTVFSGVAIATALMPPLCTAGFGLACGNMHYFLGALYLFAINCVFIALATYTMTKLFNFEIEDKQEEKAARRTKWIMTVITLIFIVPSIISAIVLVRNNDFDARATAFAKANRALENTVIYEYAISHEGGSSIELFLSGEQLDEEQMNTLMESASDHGLKQSQVKIRQNASTKSLMASDIVKDIYANTEKQLSRKEEEIASLKDELRELKQEKIPYSQIAKEAVNFYPSIQTLGISQGSNVTTDSLQVKKTLFVNAKTNKAMPQAEQDKLLQWLKVRLENEDVELNVRVEK